MSPFYLGRKTDEKVADGLNEGPSSDHQRQGENTEGLLNRVCPFTILLQSSTDDKYGPGGSAFSTTDNVKEGSSNVCSFLALWAMY